MIPLSFLHYRISTHTLTWSVTQLAGSMYSSILFQLTRSHGAWLIPGLPAFFSCAFQLTRSRGAWHIPRYVDTFEKDFNSHAHVERDLETKYGVFQPKDISTHTLTWSVTRYHVVWPDEEFEFQLTRSRGAWRHDVLLAVLFKISTHTLTWSVTSCFACSLTVPSISTHTLTWSVTSCFACSLTVPSISTHTLTWSVTPLTAYLSENVWISTHTLTWSVTFFGTVDSKVLFISTHTLTWSVTELIRHFLLSLKFQLTRSRGAWLVRLFKLSHLSIFQLTRSRGAWHFALLL